MHGPPAMPLPAPAPTLPLRTALDAAAMAIYPRLARLAGYRFEVGTDRRLRDAGHEVLRAVWTARGVAPPPDPTGFGRRYDDACTWIVAFAGGRPVGVMGLLDVHQASFTLDLLRLTLPASLGNRRVREIARLAILPEHRGGVRGAWVMVGLLREMLHWSRAQGVETLLASSPTALFRVYRRYNPTARLLDAPGRTEPESPESAAWFAAIRQLAARGSAIYTFEVAGASPSSVFFRFLTGRLRGAS